MLAMFDRCAVLEPLLVISDAGSVPRFIQRLDNRQVGDERAEACKQDVRPLLAHGVVVVACWLLHRRDAEGHCDPADLVLHSVVPAGVSHGREPIAVDGVDDLLHVVVDDGAAVTLARV